MPWPPALSRRPFLPDISFGLRRNSTSHTWTNRRLSPLRRPIPRGRTIHKRLFTCLESAVSYTIHEAQRALTLRILNRHPHQPRIPQTLSKPRLGKRPAAPRQSDSVVALLVMLDAVCTGRFALVAFSMSRTAFCAAGARASLGLVRAGGLGIWGRRSHHIAVFEKKGIVDRDVAISKGKVLPASSNVQDLNRLTAHGGSTLRSAAAGIHGGIPGRQRDSSQIYGRGYPKTKSLARRQTMMVCFVCFFVLLSISI